MMRMIAAAVLVFSASLYACAEEETEFVVAFNDLNVQLDPHHAIFSSEAQIFTALYEGLFSYDPDTTNPVKAVCRSYKLSQDGLVYTFHLRDEARWSDGTPVLARDFKDAWLRALDPRTKADYVEFYDIIEGAYEYRTGKSKDPSAVGVSVIDERILQVKLKYRADYFTRLLCHHSFSPIHPSMLGVNDWRKAVPYPVNGPYRFVSFTGELVLEKNDAYWDADSVKIPRLRAVFTDDDKAASMRFDDGDIHWLAGPTDFDTLLSRSSIQWGLMFGTHYWFFDCSAKPWNSRDIRRALALLLPLDELRSKDIYISPAQTLVLPYTNYRDAKGISARDAEEAKRLLKNAGHEDGKGLPEITVLIAQESEDNKRIAELIKSSWEALPNLRITIRSVPASDYFDLVRAGPAQGGWTVASMSWIGDFADPLAFLQMWGSDSSLNDSRYADPEFDRLLAQAAQKTGTERLKALAEAETYLLEGAAVLPINYSISANVIDTDYIDGWYNNMLDIHPFKYLAFGERSVRPNVATAADAAAAL
jgi:peptide/nickel transport system substrate-binding protein/oligopeptide transport system substrate-binding protein